MIPFKSNTNNYLIIQEIDKINSPTAFKYVVVFNYIAKIID